jgi:hypothetical protein
MTSQRESKSKIKIESKIKSKIQRKHVATRRAVCSQFNGGGVGSPPHPGSGIP